MTKAETAKQQLKDFHGIVQTGSSLTLKWQGEPMASEYANSQDVKRLKADSVFAVNGQENTVVLTFLELSEVI